MPLAAGTRIGLYEVLGRIGAGGMGEVWLATEPRLGRQVALKVLPSHLTQDPARVRRFEQEAQAAATLNHPNICTIFAIGETGEGHHYIAMEYVEGETLRNRLSTGGLRVRDSLDVAIQVAAALSAAHAAGIVHRDIKPENVMIRPDGFVKVLDFGLAKLVPASVTTGDDMTQTVLRSESGMILGTVAYMSPEQARGQAVDARSDIWSLGVMLYEAVAGRSPFAGPSGTDIIAAILARVPAPLERFAPDAPSELQRILTKALRKDVRERYQSVSDLLLDLQVLREGLPRDGAHPSTIASSSPTPKQSGHSGVRLGSARVGFDRLAVAFTMSMAAILVVGTLWWLVHARASVPAARASSGLTDRSLTRLTSGPGLQTDATFSPDGRFIAYASDRAGNFDIWVQSVSGGDPVQITKSASQDTQPQWSPDGSTIVFRSDGDRRGLFLVPALGGPEQRLTPFGMHPTWVTRGSEILFIESPSSSPDESGFGAKVKVYVTSPGTAQPAEILADFTRQGAWYWVAAHPDGRISLYGSHADRGLGFFTISRDGQSVVVSRFAAQLPVILREAPRSIRRFCWTESGTALFVEVQTGGVRNVWRVNVDPHTLEWLSADRMTTSGSNEGMIALSRDGSRLAFTDQGGATRLWTFALDASGRHLVDQGRPITDEGDAVEESDLSRDGQMIAYAMARPDQAGVDLWTTEIESRERELIAKNATTPRWSFDRRRLAYAAGSGSGIRIRDMASGDERTISPKAGSMPAILTDWTPDGSSVLASWSPRASAPWALTLWPALEQAKKEPDRILFADAALDLWEGRFSPNGRWVSFVAATRDNLERSAVMIAPAGGAPRAEWIQIASDHEWVDKPRWSADGRTIYFLSRKSTSFLNLWAVRVDPDTGRTDGSPFVLSRFDSPSLSISPRLDRMETGIGGGRAVLTLRSLTGNIWMLDHVDK
jgi:serine/threonine protein kinase